MRPFSKASLASIVVSFLVSFGATVWTLRYEPLPDFGALSVVDKKQQFFAYLRPHIESANTLIRLERARLEALGPDLDANPPNWRERLLIERLANQYDVALQDPPDYAAARQTLLGRVDIVPAALVLIQAAKESAWGTSRFARDGNNLFGQQCFVKGCGFVPKARGAGSHHEVARFDDVEHSVSAYLHNLNTHERYASMRDIRAVLRSTSNVISGVDLADGLLAYSERRDDYVREVKQMIRSNDLE